MRAVTVVVVVVTVTSLVGEVAIASRQRRQLGPCRPPSRGSGTGCNSTFQATGHGNFKLECMSCGRQPETKDTLTTKENSTYPNLNHSGTRPGSKPKKSSLLDILASQGRKNLPHPWTFYNPNKSASPVTEVTGHEWSQDTSIAAVMGSEGHQIGFSGPCNPSDPVCKLCKSRFRRKLENSPAVSKLIPLLNVICETTCCSRPPAGHPRPLVNPPTHPLPTPPPPSPVILIPTSQDLQPTRDQPYFPPTPAQPHFPPTPDQPHFPPTPDQPHFPPTPDQPHFPPTPHQSYFPPTPDQSYFPPTPDQPYPPPTPDQPYPPPTPAQQYFPLTPPSLPSYNLFPNPVAPLPLTPPIIQPPTRTPTPAYSHNLLGYSGKIIRENNKEDSMIIKALRRFPWFAAVLRVVTNAGGVAETILVCGGSLIHPSLVLTAAHCVINITTTTLKVRLGAWNHQQGEEMTQQERDVKAIAIHHHFNKNTFWNDIALLHLQEPVVLTSSVMPICLGHVVGPAWCLAVGWAGNAVSMVEIPVWHKEACQQHLDSVNVEGMTLHHPSLLCTSTTMPAAKSAGSPLLCRDPTDGTYYQAGVMAFDLPLDSSGVTGVYVNVSQAHEWIVSAGQDLLTRMQEPKNLYWDRCCLGSCRFLRPS